MCHARDVDEPIAGEASPRAEITFPDGTTLACDSPEAARRLSVLFGKPVTLRALGPAGSDAPPQLNLSDEAPGILRERMGLSPGEPIADLSAFTPEHLRLLRQGNFFDAHTIHRISRTTLRTLARLAPESDRDTRRFRANLLVELDDREGYPEHAWVGRSIRVGTAVIEVATGCPRCVMVTQAVGELPQDHRQLRTLVRETRHTAGIYARIVEEGEVRVGDAAEVIAWQRFAVLSQGCLVACQPTACQRPVRFRKKPEFR